MTLSKITWAIIAIKSIITLKFSRLFKSIILFFTFLSNSSQSSIFLHQKSYFIVTNFYIMFYEKNRNKIVKIIQIDVFFSMFKFQFLFQINRSNSKFLQSISIWSTFRIVIFRIAIVKMSTFYHTNYYDNHFVFHQFFSLFRFRFQFWITCFCMHKYTSSWRTFWY